MKSLLLTGMSFMLTTLVIGNAYFQKQQFYPSVVYITKSNPSMAVMYMQALVFVILAAKLLRKIFFGQLRAAEMEHLIERSWYAVTETCLAFTVFRDDFSPRFVALFTLLLFLKCFHWLAEDRIDFMERSPAISWLFHLRALSLIFVLATLDILFVRHAFYFTILKGPSVQLVFGFEYEILFTVVLMTFIKYILHTIDLQNENPWDNKAMYLLYSELIMGSIRVILYILFFAVMIKVHTFPLFAIRPMYLTLRAFQKAAQDVILSRRAIRNMNTLYPDATPEELSSGDNVCIICREEMTTGCKKLPCNHILHTNCLRSWFQRQQTCPTCRLEVLRMPQANGQPRQQQNEQQPQAGAQQQQPQQQHQPQPQVQNPFNNMPGVFGGLPFQWPPNMAAGQAMPPAFGWPPQQQQQQQQQPQPQTPPTSTSDQTESSSQSQAGSVPATPTPASPTSTATPTASAFPEASSQPPLPPFGMGMSFPGIMAPPVMPSIFGPMGFPSAPRPLEGLSDEELRSMEGLERTNVEARIHWLRDIQTLLDGAMVLIAQYNTVSSQLGSAGIHLAPPNIGLNPSAPASSSQSSSPNSTSPSSSLPSTSPSLSSTSSSLSQQQQATWWPAGEGARPKYTSPPSNVYSHSSSKPTRVSSQPDTEHHQVSEGATALKETNTVDSPTGGVIPKWDDPRNAEQDDESMHEIRKRRLQRFEQSNDTNASQNANDVNDSS